MSGLERGMEKPASATRQGASSLLYCMYGSGRRSEFALLTPLATWSGFVYVAFVIDVFARRIVGWRVSRTARADFVLDALEQALHEQQPLRRSSLTHHSGRGVQYV